MNSNASSATGRDAAVPAAKKPGGSRTTMLMLVCDLAAPLALFYGLRGAGVGVWLAALLGGVPPIAYALYKLIVERVVDGFAVFIVSLLLLGAVVSFVTGDPRLLLAKDGWITGVAGIWFLISLRLKEPFLLTAIRPFMVGDRAPVLEQAWAKQHVRSGLRLLTAVWGGALILDAVLRVVLAYTLPVDEVPLVSTIQYVALICVLQLLAQVYGRRRGFIQEFKKKPVPATGA